MTLIRPTFPRRAITDWTVGVDTAATRRPVFGLWTMGDPGFLSFLRSQKTLDITPAAFDQTRIKWFTIHKPMPLENRGRDLLCQFIL